VLFVEGYVEKTVLPQEADKTAGLPEVTDKTAGLPEVTDKTQTLHK